MHKAAGNQTGLDVFRHEEARVTTFLYVNRRRNREVCTLCKMTKEYNTQSCGKPDRFRHVQA